jgi:hypothetical protein
MIAKLREVFNADPIYAFYREFPDKMFTQEQKNSEMLGFLINSLLFNTEQERNA